MSSPPLSSDLHRMKLDSISADDLINIPQDDKGRAQRDKSPNTMSRVTVRNRRKRYLETHPEYFESPWLELAGLGCVRAMKVG